VIVRMSDFKTNEYAGLLGGAGFEPKRGKPDDRLPRRLALLFGCLPPGFALECQAMARLRNEMGFDNVTMMIPFCRSIGEADRVLEVMAKRSEARRERAAVYVMCEIPSNVILAKEFATVSTASPSAPTT
jgi:pyruvate,water dikinase